MSIRFIPRFFLLQWKRCGFKNMHNLVAPDICFAFVSVSTLVLHLCFSGEGRGDREDLRQLRSPSRLPHRPLCRCYEWVQHHHHWHNHHQWWFTIPRIWICQKEPVQIHQFKHRWSTDNNPHQPIYHVAVVVAAIKDTATVGAPVRSSHGGGEGAWPMFDIIIIVNY